VANLKPFSSGSSPFTGRPDAPAGGVRSATGTANAGRLHFGPLGYWINDPAGLVYCDGVYHLFYQLNPHGRHWGNMHWGHAVSPDLLRWNHRPIAIPPHPELGMAFTGSVVVDTDNSSGLFPGDTNGFVAFLTTAKASTEHHHLVQTQSIAYSHDHGETWTWHPANPVIPNNGEHDFRDPKVFRHRETGYWIAAISRGGSIVFYRSRDLIRWRFTSVHELDYVPDVCECPDLLRFTEGGSGGEKDTWALMYALAHDSAGHGAGVRYVTGSFDGRRFHRDIYPERRVDYGPDFYAAQSWYGRARPRTHVIVAWANNPAYAKSLPARWPERTGLMTLPRRLTLVHGEAGPRLRQTPVTAPHPGSPQRRVSSYRENSATCFDCLRDRFPFQLHVGTRSAPPEELEVRLQLHLTPEDRRHPDRGTSDAKSAAAGKTDILVFRYQHAQRSLTVTRSASPAPSHEPAAVAPPGASDGCTAEPAYTQETTGEAGSHSPILERFWRTDQIRIPPETSPFRFTLILEEGIAELFLYDGTTVATYQWIAASGTLRLTVDTRHLHGPLDNPENHTTTENLTLPALEVAGWTLSTEPIKQADAETGASKGGDT